jgi:hypothetical protein
VRVVAGCAAFGSALGLGHGGLCASPPGGS